MPTRSPARAAIITCHNEGGCADSLTQWVLGHSLVLATVLKGHAGDDEGAHTQHVSAVQRGVSVQALVVLEPGDAGPRRALHCAGHAALAALGQQVSPQTHQEAGLLAQVGFPVCWSLHCELLCGEFGTEGRMVKEPGRPDWDPESPPSAKGPEAEPSRTSSVQIDTLFILFLKLCFDFLNY